MQLLLAQTMAHVQNKPLKCQNETLSAILACTSDRGFEIPVVQLTTRLRITVANQTIPPYSEVNHVATAILEQKQKARKFVDRK